MDGDGYRSLMQIHQHDERQNNISAAHADAWRTRGDHDAWELQDLELDRLDRLNDYTPVD